MPLILNADTHNRLIIFVWGSQLCRTLLGSLTYYVLALPIYVFLIDLKFGNIAFTSYQPWPFSCFNICMSSSHIAILPSHFDTYFRGKSFFAVEFFFESYDEFSEETIFKSNNRADRYWKIRMHLKPNLKVVASTEMSFPRSLGGISRSQTHKISLFWY